MARTSNGPSTSGATGKHRSSRAGSPPKTSPPQTLLPSPRRPRPHHPPEPHLPRSTRMRPSHQPANPPAYETTARNLLDGLTTTEE